VAQQHVENGEIKEIREQIYREIKRSGNKSQGDREIREQIYREVKRSGSKSIQGDREIREQITVRSERSGRRISRDRGRQFSFSRLPDLPVLSRKENLVHAEPGIDEEVGAEHRNSKVPARGRTCLLHQPSTRER
jgi:hypothetical protein